MRRGFTLIELMTGVAIIGILFALSITEYRLFQFKAKRSEPLLQVDAIASTQRMYNATHDAFVTAPSNPGTPLNMKLRDWDQTEPSWAELGFFPDGAVRCNYETGPQGDGSWYRVEATCDIDHDGQVAIIRWDSEEAPSPGLSDLYPARF